MKKYLMSFGVLAAAALSMTSCLSNNSSDQKYTFNYGGVDCFNRVYDMDTEEYSITMKPSYTFVYNMTTGSLEVSMSDIKLGDSGYAGMSFKLSDLTFKQATDMFWVTNATNVIPYGASQSFVFNSFNLRALPMRMLGNGSIPAYSMNYVVNNRYRVTVYPTQYVYFGSVSASNIDDQTTYYDNQTNSSTPSDGITYYAVKVDPEKMLAQLLVYGAKYSEKMSRYNFTVKDLPVELTNSGYIIRTAADKKYDIYNEKSTDKPVEDQNISDITISGNIESGANITFSCDLGDDGKFGVSAYLKYLPYDTAGN